MTVRPFSLLLLWLAMTTAQAVDDPATLGPIDLQTPQWDEYTNGDWTGIYADTFKAAFEPLGIEIEVTFTPYEVSISRVQNGEADVAMSAYLGEFDGLLYPQWPQERERVMVAHRRETAYENANSLVGRSSAWLREYGFEEHLPEGIDYREVRTESLGLRMLERGQLDFFIDYEPTIRAAAEEGGVDLAGIQLSQVDELSKFVYPMFRNDERGEALRALYDERMKVLYEDGTLDTIFKRYGRERYPRMDAE